jgi:hypothetical protein
MNSGPNSCCIRRSVSDFVDNIHKALTRPANGEKISRRDKENTRSLTLSLDNILNATIPRAIMPRSRDDSVRHEKPATIMVITVRMTGSKIPMVNCHHALQVLCWPQESLCYFQLRRNKLLSRNLPASLYKNGLIPPQTNTKRDS